MECAITDEYLELKNKRTSIKMWLVRKKRTRKRRRLKRQAEILREQEKIRKRNKIRRRKK